MNNTFTTVAAVFLAAISMTASAQSAYTIRSVNVRSGPDTSYPPVAVLATGAPVQVMGCVDDWSWCDVAFGDNRGWMYAPYLNYDYQGARVPFYSYAPAFGIPIVTFSVGPYWDRYYRGRDFYGRRDYWYGRPPPVHVRPVGPPPRAAIPPSYRVHTETHGPDYHGAPGYGGNPGGNPNYNANRGNNNYNNNYNASHPNNTSQQHTNSPSQPHGTQQYVQGAPGGKPPPTNTHPQEMRRASPTTPAAPVSRGAPVAAPQGHPPQGAPQGAPQAAPQGHPQGNAGHGNEHAGSKDEPHHQ